MTNKASGAVKGNMLNQWMQAGRLVLDSRVPFSLKLLLPFAAVLYWLWPIDLMPGLPFDDVAVLFFALTFFVQLANQAIEKAGAGAGFGGFDSAGTYNGTSAGTPGGANPSNTDIANKSADGNVVDTTWRVIE
jgi:uncharacterized membrane protein YkvA (DUF1232 family)